MRRHTISVFATILLGVGIGSATAMFSIVEAVWLRPLPMAAADRLVTISAQNPKRNITDGPFSWAAYQAIEAAGLPHVVGLSAFATDRFTITGVADPEQISGGRVSASFFGLLGVPIAAGRGFLPDEDKSGGPSSVILGRDLWRRRFGGDKGIVGHTIVLDGSPRLVVGTLDVELPPPFAGVDVWTTRVWEVGSLTPAQVASGAGFLGAVARLSAGARLEAVQPALDGVQHAYAASHAGNTDADPAGSLRLTPFVRQMVGTAAQPLAVLSAAVAIVVLIACANVAGLLLVRGNARRREWMIRVAVGATRARIMRQMCGEALVTAILACIAGLFVSWAALRLSASALSDLPRGGDVSLQAASVVFAIACALITSLAAALIPAWRAASHATSGEMRTGSRSIVRGARTGGILVTAEVTLAVVLIVGAALMLRSLNRLLNVPIGYNPEGVVTMRLSLPAPRYPSFDHMQALVARLIERTSGVPGLASAAVTMNLPPEGSLFGPFQDAAEAPKPVGERPIAQWSSITPGYFRTMGIQLVAGRPFDDRDTAATPRVAIVSRSLADRLWPGRDPLGQRLFVARLAEPSTIVGVVADVRNAGLDRPPVDQMYSPYAQRPWPSFVLTARAAHGNPMQLAAGLTAALHEIDPDLAPTTVRTAAAALGAASAQARLTAAIMTTFGVLALAMAAAGLYGVIAYSVAQRVREIGLRVALGAQYGQILGLVVGHALRLSLAGIALGIPAALVLGRMFAALLYDTTPNDPFVFAAVAALFLTVGAAASAVPARRALRVDPMAVLRMD